MSPRISRRRFLAHAGVGATGLCCGRTLGAIGSSPIRVVPVYNDLDDVRLRDGHVLIRLEMTRGKEDKTLAAKLEVPGAQVAKLREYFFEASEDACDRNAKSWRVRLTRSDIDVVTLWLQDASPKTRIEVAGQADRFAFTLEALLTTGQINKTLDGVRFGANFLLDREIGKIDPAEVGITAKGDDFDFVIFADPQGGDPTDLTNDSPERVAIHNPYILKNVRAVNKLRPQPAFLIVAGDIVDSKGQKSNYDVLVKFLRELRMPVLFELGNHETRYGAKFSPGYNHAELKNYFDAQRQINGTDKLLYSFDVGRWHFVIWPDPLRKGFWEQHPHYFEWLDEDLHEHKDRPTILVQHISPLPIGIDPMTAYVETPAVKRRLLDIVTQHGNVKYVFSGHTHITLKASMKTARTYKGVKFINLPAAGYRPRAFGEADLEPGPSQGFALVKIRGSDAEVQFDNVMRRIHRYPDTFPEFKPDQWPLWLGDRWELPAHRQLQNGRFEDGLDGWARRFVYDEDNNPSNICRVDEDVTYGGMKTLYMFCRERGHHVRGQDRMAQTINRICQAVALDENSAPRLRLAYRLDGRYFDPSKQAGAYTWLQGFDGSDIRLNMIYSAGMAFPNPLGGYGGGPSYVHWDITAAPDRWHELTIHVTDDHNRQTKGQPFDRLDLDKLVITLGVWTENMETDQSIGIHFANLRLDNRTSPARRSHVDDRDIELKPKNQIWNKRLTHIDGEHVYVAR